VAEHLAGAAVDEGNKDAPAVAPAVDEGEVGRPALVGLFGDGAGDLDAWAVSGAALGKRPALELHDAVDFLDVNRDSLLVAETAPGAAHATGRFFLVDPPDARDHGLIHRLWTPLPGLVIGGGAR